MEIGKEIKQSKFQNEFHKASVNILFTASWLSVSLSKALRPFGVSVQQFNILRILRGQSPNPVSVKMLQERMLDKMSNASRLVEKLRNKNLVVRTENEKDRRQVDVKISEKGMGVLFEIDKIMPGIERMLFHINENEAGELNRLLDTLRG
jgi:DNA-binding MarR family transcriptional regulator